MSDADETRDTVDTARETDTAEETSSPAATSDVPQIVATEDVLGGDPRIEGRRIGVHTIYRRYVEIADEPAAIATDYDLSLAEIHAALAYAFANTEEMEAIRSRTEETREQIETLTPKE